MMPSLQTSDLIRIGPARCYMIAACDRVRDYERAVQWKVMTVGFLIRDETRS
jgi:hypothetical protein